MNPKDLFLAALEKPAAEREAYLAELPLEARQRVRELLSAHAAEAGALGSLPSDSPTATIPIDTPAPVDPQAAATLEMGRATQATTSAAGQHLGPYDLLEVLGQGGFGTVFRAFDQKLHRVVAVKVLAPELAAQGPARQRFLREARAAAAVRYENVIAIHAVDEEPRPHLVMEYISGKTLQQKIDQDGALATLEILRIGGQIAAGLAAAHQQGLIHRDIKPANILLENGVERVKISDFGLARAVDDASISQSGIIAGTPMYMSPEQAEGKPLDPRTDLFSLGSTLYTMCAGHAPFRATSTLAVLKRVTEDEPRPIRESNPAIPDWLSAVVARLMAKNPEERFQSAKEVAELLQQHLAHEQQPGLARRPAALPPTPTAKTRRSERLLFLGRGLLALFALAALLWILEARGITSFSRFLWFFHHEVTLLLPDRETIVEIFETTDTEARPDAFSIKLGWPFPAKALIVDEEKKEVRLPPGNYWLLAKRRGQQIDRQLLTIPWGGRRTVEIVDRAAADASDEPARAAGPFPTEQARQLQEDWAKHLRQPAEISNSLGMKLRLVPPGEFDMGLADQDLARLEELGRELKLEKVYFESLREMQPRHRVRLSRPFWMCCHEISVGHFRAFIEATGHQTDAERHGQGVGWINEAMARGPEFTWRAPGYAPVKDDLPVTLVSWNDAQAFARWLSGKEKRRYRLPTEAEWEFACRAGTASMFHTGDRLLASEGNRGWSHRRPVKGGSYPPNAFGLFDMHGNVGEWCADNYGASYYSSSERMDPRGPSDRKYRCLRGGAFDTEELRCAAGYRFKNPPLAALQMAGFRLVLEAEE